MKPHRLQPSPAQTIAGHRWTLDLLMQVSERPQQTTSVRCRHLSYHSLAPFVGIQLVEAATKKAFLDHRRKRRKLLVSRRLPLVSHQRSQGVACSHSDGCEQCTSELSLIMAAASVGRTRSNSPMVIRQHQVIRTSKVSRLRGTSGAEVGSRLQPVALDADVPLILVSISSSEKFQDALALEFWSLGYQGASQHNGRASQQVVHLPAAGRRVGRRHSVCPWMEG